MHASAVGRTRDERVAQVRERADPTLRDFAAYVPVEGAFAKLALWHEQGARIDYLSSHRSPDAVRMDASILRRYGFPLGRVLHRRFGERYGDVAGRDLPDVLIEDDCES